MLEFPVVFECSRGSHPKLIALAGEDIFAEFAVLQFISWYQLNRLSRFVRSPVLPRKL